MARKMKAAIFKAPETIELELIDIPETGQKDILIKIRAVGICGSDIHTYKTGLFSYPNQIMGHEFSGEIVEIGESVEGLQLGDRVTGFTVSFCGECFWCKRGESRLCPQLFDSYSGYGKPGAMAEYLLIENAKLNENVFRIPENVTDEVAATAEPLGTAIYTMYRTKPKTEDQVVILGAGMIGNLIAQVMKTVPACKVIVTEVSKYRLDKVKNTGADIVIDASDGPLLARIQEHTGIGKHHFGEGGMADIVIDAAGVPATLAKSLEFVRSKGTVGLVGINEVAAPIDTRKIIHKDIRIVGIMGSVIPKGIDYLSSGLVNTESLITLTFSLDQASEAFMAAVNDASAIKVIMKP